MKTKATAFLIMLMVVGHITNAQHDNPFPTENAKWFQVKWEPNLQPPPLYFYHTTTFETTGDTIIGGKSYTTVGQGWYDGAYRVEKDSNLVYYFDYNENEELLVYDYNLVPGDTMYIKNLVYVCTDTGSYLLNNGKYHKYQIMYVDHGGFDCEQIWIHGIGSLRDPISEPLGGCNYMMYQQGRDVSCFYVNDTLVYEWNDNPYFHGCEGSNIGIDDVGDIDQIFRIAPNPVTDISRVTVNFFGETIVDFKIFDMTGRLLKTQRNSNISNIRISKHDFGCGIFILHLIADNNVHVIKFSIY